MWDPAQALRARATLPGVSPFREERGDRWALFLDSVSTDREAFALSVARGLSDNPRWLNCRYLYDAKGSEIFSKITDQPEYYPTRAEDEILSRYAGEIRERVGALPIVELGSGTSAKTRRLLEAWTEQGPAHYVPIDIDPSVVRDSAATLTRDFDSLRVSALATSYERALEQLDDLSPKMLMFLGSTLGNFSPPEVARFLERIEDALHPGDFFLLGVDLVKSADVLEPAYDDAAGYTRAFTRNLFERMNRELGTDVPLDAVEHVAFWNDRLERIEIYARFSETVTIRLKSIQREFRIARGEMVMTEISRKFRIERLATEIGHYGLRLEKFYRDSEQRFAVLLIRRVPKGPRTTLRRKLNAELWETREKTRQIVEPLGDEQLFRGGDRSIARQLEHLAGFEERIRLEHLGDPNGTTDPICTHWTRAAAVHTRRASIAQYLTAVRAQTLRELQTVDFENDHPLLEEGLFYRRLAQHEAQHHEQILQSIQSMAIPYEPVCRVNPPSVLRAPEGSMVLVPGGPCRIGSHRSSRAPFSTPEQWVNVSSFWIDTVPVTNGDMLNFIEDGGYEKRRLWSDGGWVWRTEANAHHPSVWHRDNEGWKEQHFGRWERLARYRPVIHVSQYEAAAYARWAGKRLPSEEEWEMAASWDPEYGIARKWPWGDEEPTPERANLDCRTFGPAPVGVYPSGRSIYGCQQMIGDVWEWTSSTFRADSGSSLETSDPSKELRVARGGSWATSTLLACNSARAFHPPHERNAFVGFRCARSA